MTCHPATSANTKVDKETPDCYSVANVGLPVAVERPTAKKPPSNDDFHGGQKSEKSDSGMSLTSVQLHVLWRETNREVDSLTQAVSECKSVDQASSFGRWLRYSGVLQILEAHPAPFPLIVDGKALTKKVTDLIYECGELYKGGKHDPRYAASDIAEINRKLDILAAHIGQSSPPLMATTTDAGDAAEPVLLVLQGGVS